MMWLKDTREWVAIWSLSHPLRHLQDHPIQLSIGLLIELMEGDGKEEKMKDLREAFGVHDGDESGVYYIQKRDEQNAHGIRGVEVG
ncbi:hypothetical protein Gotur_012169 [Gossypium turneri]